MLTWGRPQLVFCSAQLHDAINALLHARKSELQTAVRALGRIGQTSGWDTLAGAVTTYRARFAGNMISSITDTLAQVS